MSRNGPKSVVLYTRVGCHLCDDAAELLRAHGLAPKLVDIDADPALRAAHHEWVPVVPGGPVYRGQAQGPSEKTTMRILN